MDTLFEKRRMLADYLRDVHQMFPRELLDELSLTDPSYYFHIQTAEVELIRLNALIKARQNQPTLPSFTPQRLIQGTFVFSPTAPQQTTQKALKSSTMFTPLPTIVSPAFTHKYRGINWPHYENMLKLFALGYLVRNGQLTQQQEKDKEELSEAIETVGNAKAKKKKKTAEEIMNAADGVYMTYGRNVIRAMAEPDPIVSERCLKDLRSEIPDTRNDQNAIQLHKMMSKAKTIFMAMQSRYKTSN